MEGIAVNAATRTQIKTDKIKEKHCESHFRIPNHLLVQG